MELFSARDALHMTDQRFREIELEKSGFTEAINIVRSQIEKAVSCAKYEVLIAVHNSSLYATADDELYEDKHNIEKLIEYLIELHYKVSIEDCMWDSGSPNLKIIWG